jgi:hypothetical protein
VTHFFTDREPARRLFDSAAPVADHRHLSLAELVGRRPAAWLSGFYAALLATATCDRFSIDAILRSWGRLTIELIEQEG